MQLAAEDTLSDSAGLPWTVLDSCKAHAANYFDTV